MWGYTFYGSDRVVDDTIRRLRKKLADIDASTTFIETAWGVGYKLRGAPGDTGHGA